MQSNAVAPTCDGAMVKEVAYVLGTVHQHCRLRGPMPFEPIGTGTAFYDDHPRLEASYLCLELSQGIYGSRVESLGSKE